MATARKPRLIDDVDGDRIDQPETFNPTEAVETLNRAFAGAGDATRQAMETGRQVQEEFTAFCQQRLQSNTEAASQMMKCKSMPEFFEAQQIWAKTAADHYSGYLNRVFSLMQGSFRPPFDKK